MKQSPEGDIVRRLGEGLDRQPSQLDALRCCLRQDFGMPQFPMEPLRGAMCQHDFDGRRIFQHRNFLKWDAESGSIPGFLYENDCRRLLNSLDRRLSSA